MQSAERVPASVPGRAHYSLAYLRCGRIFSFAHQIDAALSFEPQSILEVGVGSGVVTAALRAAGCDVTTLDVQPELEPDLVGSVMKIPVSDGEFDVAICCQVLEHLPFQCFPAALSELSRVTKGGLVLSLPDVTRHIELGFHLPKLGRRWFSWSIGLGRAKVMPPNRAGGEHQWEIGFRGFPLRDVKRAIEAASLRVVRTWRVPELAWHRFFLCSHLNRG